MIYLKALKFQNTFYYFKDSYEQNFSTVYTNLCIKLEAHPHSKIKNQKMYIKF